MTSTTSSTPGAQTDEELAASLFFRQLCWWAIVTVFAIPLPALVGWSKAYTAAIGGVSAGAIVVILMRHWHHLTAPRPRSITADVTREGREQLYRDLDRECVEEWARGVQREFSREE